jgi:protein TonB
MRYFLAILIASICLVSAGMGQIEDAGETGRKVVKRVMPRYPEMAKKMNLTGTVKVVAVVSAEGKVRAIQPVGGSPLLLQAAQEAIAEWKFAPSGSESKEPIELHFNPR